MTATLASLNVRNRWRELSAATPLLTVALLAGYTIDPVLPHLGVALHDAGLPARLHTGPYDQIVQECLHDDSATARLRPDVLVVAPRLDGPASAAELPEVVATAVAAARRWSALLVVVLPHVPERREHGVFDLGDPGSPVAVAAQARERCRAALAGVPGAYLVDAEPAVRVAGSAAFQPALYRFAKIPYTEGVFASLGAAIARVIAAAHGAAPRAVVLEGDFVAGCSGVAAEVLADQVRLLHRIGLRIGVLAGDAGWPEIVAVIPREVPFVGADELGVEPVVLTGSADRFAGPVLELTGDPDAWPERIRRSGLLDRLPALVRQSASEPVAAPVGALSLADYVAGLGVEIELIPVGATIRSTVDEVVSRAKDFTTGVYEIPPGAAAFAVGVRDRLGEYGISGAFTLRHHGFQCLVEVFSLSCPVLGKGAEDKVFAEIVTAAAGQGATRLVIRHAVTEHNRVAVEFLGRVAGRQGGLDVVVEVAR